MNEQKWIKYFLVISTILTFLVVSINYVIDPFNIFNSGFFKHHAQHNERFLKIEHLEKNHFNYNSYIFGSSRVGTTDPKIIEHYIPNSKFYNMTVASANLYDYVMHLKYMIKSNYEIKNLYLQIDIRDMERYGRSDSDYQKKLHPYVTNDTLNKFYIKYLFGFFPKNVKEKIIKNINYKATGNYFLYTNGMWENTEAEERISKDCRKYITNEKSFHKKIKRNKRLMHIDKTTTALREIKKLCEENNIHLYVFTTPHNKNMMNSFVVNDYLKFLKYLSNETDFYDFSGYNSVTKNDCNYYEISHYRPLVAKLIATKIFNDDNIQVPNDFGVFITKENIDRHIKNLKSKF